MTPRTSGRPRAGRRAPVAAGPRTGAARPAVATPDAPPALAVRVLWVSLALLSAARLVACGLPGTWAWSLDLQRFLVAPLAVATWTLAAAALVPRLAGALGTAMARFGDAIASVPWRAAAAAALVTALIVGLLPDRTYFVGDFLMRFGSVAGRISTDFLFPQALPLDLLVHHRLPLAAAPAGIGGEAFERLLGVAESAVLGALAVAYVRALGLTGGTAAAACAVVILGGHLAVFTGLGKAFRELAVLTLATGVAAVKVAREGRGHAALAVAASLAVLFHRSAVMLLPAVVVSSLIGWRRHPRSATAATLAVAVPAATLAFSLPRIFGAMRTIDAAHLAPAGAGGALGAAFAPLHLLDIANTLIALSPAALPLAVAAAVARPRLAGRPEAAVHAALALPALLLLLFVHPRQGVFRDQDVFAAAGVALSMTAAWLAGFCLGGRAAWLAPAVALAAAVPTFQWLLVHHDPAAGMRRVESFAAGRPLRPDAERAGAWGYLSTRHAMLGQLDQAAESAARAAALAPSPRLLYEWGEAERARGDLVASRRAFETLVGRAPPFVPGWLRLGEVALELGDLGTARRAAERARALAPEAAEARALADAVTRAAALADTSGTTPR